MKKIAILLATAMMFLCTACNDSSDDSNSTSTLKKSGTIVQQGGKTETIMDTTE